MGKEYAAKGTRHRHIQMGAKAVAPTRYKPSRAAYVQAIKEYKANMAKETWHKEVDPQGSPDKTRLL